MNKLLNIFMLICLMFPNYSKQIFSQEIDKEQALFTFMKVYNINPNSAKGNVHSDNDKCGKTYQTYYAIKFDNINYKRNRNDEFTKNNYWKSIHKKILQRIKDVDFKYKFTLTKGVSSGLGEYSFSSKSFPVQISMINYYFYYDSDCFFEILIGDVINSNAISLNLNMPVEKAKKFITKRKDSNGNINRTIYSRFIFSILDKKIGRPLSAYAGENLVAYIHSIELFEDKYLTNKLSTLYPNID